MFQKTFLAFMMILITASWTMAQLIAVPDGYAEHAGTTGGGNATPVTVSSASEFRSAVNNSNPAVIIVNGKLNVGSVTIGSNKTIVGLDSTSGLYGGTIKIQGTNYIIQNLNFGPASGDVMEVSGGTKVFITKCSFFDSSDELFSIVREADYVTVSWCKFYFSNPGSHNFAHLIGNSYSCTSDRGKLHVTMHHNWYAENVRGRMPRVRYGHVHIYNNYYNSLGNGYCIGVGYECHIRVENTYFENINSAWADYGGVSNGEMGWDNLKFVSCSQPTFVQNSFPVFSPPYTYSMDPVESVKDIVMDGAGNVFGITSVDENVHAIPTQFKLYPAYPNPFNAETKIQFSVSHPAEVSISVFDINGRLIRTLFNQEVTVGEHSFTWNASDLTSGVYFIRLSSERFSATSKCTLIK